MKNLISLATLLALLPVCASAQTYVRAAAIWQDIDDVEVTGAARFMSSVDEAYGISAAVGYKFGGIRAEAEVISISNEFASDGAGTTATTYAKGDIDQYRLSANIYYDIPILPIVHPYIGAGVGLGHFSINDFQGVKGTDNYVGDGDANILAFQFMVGLKAELPIEGLFVYGGYRFVRTDGYEQEFNNSDPTATDAFNVIMKSSNMFELGVGYTF